jgi:hypothetical protein
LCLSLLIIGLAFSMAPLYCSQGHENPTAIGLQACGEKLTQPDAQSVEAGMVMGVVYRIVRDWGMAALDALI